MKPSTKPEPNETPLEVLPPSAVESLQRGEIDVQIATAHRYPRSIAQFKKRALEMVSLDEETAESCIYARPVGKDKKGKEIFAEGMSVRMAEIVGACYGNLRVQSTIVEMTPRFVTARGTAHDLESNYASASEIVESTVDRWGKPYSERMRIVAAKAALAKARRDATFVVVPKALCKPIEEQARKVAIGDASTLAKRRAAVMGWIGKLGIDINRVFAALGVKGEEDIGVDQLTTLTGIKTAIKDGDATIDESFPQLGEIAKGGDSVPNFSTEPVPEINAVKGGVSGSTEATGSREPSAASRSTPQSEVAPDGAAKAAEDDLGWPAEENA